MDVVCVWCVGGIGCVVFGERVGRAVCYGGCLCCVHWCACGEARFFFGVDTQWELRGGKMAQARTEPGASASARSGPLRGPFCPLAYVCFLSFWAVANSRIRGRPFGRKCSPTHVAVFPLGVVVRGSRTAWFRDDRRGAGRAPQGGNSAGIYPGVSEPFRFRDTSYLRATWGVLFGGVA